MAGFLERVRQEIDHGVVQIGARSKQLVETTQLRSQLRLLKGRREEGIRELGQIVYEMLQGGELDRGRVGPYLAALQQLDAQIAAVEEGIRKAQLEAEKAIRTGHPPAFAYCNSCGTTLQESSKFCPGCGQDVREIVQRASAARAASAEKICPSCGATVDPAARFCPSCGQALV